MRDLSLSLLHAPRLVAADGGADRLLKLGMEPEAVIGDLDSLSPKARATIAAEKLHLVSEQATTDFDKALRSIAAPFVIAVGFSGGRCDHALAALNSLIRHSGRACLILGQKDITFAAPPREIELTLKVGDPLSLFPMSTLEGRSEGLHWPIEGLTFAPDGFIGTSNKVSAPKVRLSFNRSGMLVTLPRRRLPAVLAALAPPAPPAARDR